MKISPIHSIILLIFACLVLAPVFAQEEEISSKVMFIEAESYFLFEDYEEALPLYQRILRVEPENYNVIYKVGICYLDNIYQQSKSIKYLEDAAQHINLKYRDDNYREKLAPLDAHYYLGRAYHVNNMLDKAIQSYEYFAKVADPKEYDLDLVADDIRSCELAKKMFAKPVYFHPENMGAPINTRYEELNPVLSGDGNTFAFTRRLQFYDGVFISTKDESGNWTDPVDLTPFFGLDGNSYTTGISFFGDEIFVYRSDDFDGNIYSSKKINDQWMPLQKLNDNINTKFWESHASPSPDGQFLYFTSNREGGYGGLDIYKAKRGSKNEWGPAINVGPVINTPGNEETPFLGNEGYSLFFSSQGHKTIGDYDVFITTLRSNGTWSKPRNMGSPVNTTGPDLFYTPLNVNAFGFYSLYDPETTNGLRDIYSVEVYNEMIPRTFTITGSLEISGADETAFKNMNVFLYDTGTQQLVSKAAVDKEGNYSLNSASGEYNLVVEGAEIETYKKKISLDITNPNHVLALPAIALTAAALDGTPAVAAVPVPKKSEIIIKNDFYAVADSESVPIELILPRGVNLQIDVVLEDTLYRRENITTERKRFTYFYKPQVGENLLQFLAVDEEGVEYVADVIVTYYPPIDSYQITDADYDTTATSMEGSYIGWVASAELLRYLESLSFEDFENYYSLYNHLLSNSQEQGYSQEDIDEMFAILFTQRDLDQFSDELLLVRPDTSDQFTNILDKTQIPIEYVQALQDEQVLTRSELDIILLNMLQERKEMDILVYDEIFLYSDADKDALLESAQSSYPDKMWEVYKANNSQAASHTLQLAATTTSLSFFYQNMLLTSEGDLYNHLDNLDFDSLEIYTSIDLTKQLLEDESSELYTLSDLIRALELASSLDKYYLSKFREALTEKATGNLKSELVSLQELEPDLNTYEGLINYLIDKSEFESYSRENVFSLLLSLIDIEDVNEFAEKLISYNNTTINRALADTSMQYFSNPFELIQYLLAVSENYNFSASEINNLLIRMILEQGILESASDENDEISENIWGNKKFVTTIILVNLLLLLVLILFLYRRKSNR